MLLLRQRSADAEERRHRFVVCIHQSILIGVADELLVHYRGGVGKSNEKGGGGPLEVGTWKPEGGI